MPAHNETLDLTPLTSSARREVRDFYEFILTRCRQARKKTTPRILPSAFDTPIKVKEYQKVLRDEIYDEV